MTKYFTKEHEWLALQDDRRTWRVGITDYAQDQLGDVVTVELPQAGTQLGAGDACAVVESVKSASDIYAPLVGTISAVNDRLADEPELVNQSAEGEGWLFELQIEGEPDTANFLNAQQYAELTAE